MKSVLKILVASAVLAAAVPAAATPAQEMELRSLGQCALAGNLYKSLMGPGAPIKPTDADKALYVKLQAANPTLSQRAEQLAMAVGPEKSMAIRTKLMAELKAQIEPTDGPKLEPRAALDRYAPILEACVTRADLLSGLSAPIGEPVN
jgi:hypothetical protein